MVNDKAPFIVNDKEPFTLNDKVSFYGNCCRTDAKAEESRDVNRNDSTGKEVPVGCRHTKSIS